MVGANGKKYVNCYLKSKNKMSESIKLEEGYYWDSNTIMHRREELKSILDNSLFLRGEIPETDLNNLEKTGIYYTSNIALSNIPVTASEMEFGVVIVIKCGGSNGIIHQYIIQPFRDVFYIRQKSGSPMTWKPWKQIELK